MIRLPLLLLLLPLLAGCLVDVGSPSDPVVAAAVAAAQVEEEYPDALFLWAAASETRDRQLLAGPDAWRFGFFSPGSDVVVAATMDDKGRIALQAADAPLDYAALATGLPTAGGDEAVSGANAWLEERGLLAGTASYSTWQHAQEGGDWQVRVVPFSGPAQSFVGGTAVQASDPPAPPSWDFQTSWGMATDVADAWASDALALRVLGFEVLDTRFGSVRFGIDEMENTFLPEDLFPGDGQPPVWAFLFYSPAQQQTMAVAAYGGAVALSAAPRNARDFPASVTGRAIPDGVLDIDDILLANSVSLSPTYAWTYDLGYSPALGKPIWEVEQVTNDTPELYRFDGRTGAPA